MTVDILIGDCIEKMRELPQKSVNTCVTSPPYFGLRDYGHDGQIGLEPTPDAYVAKMVDVFREVRRVLRDDGTLWLNIGDSYATGTKAARQQSTNPGVGANRPEAQNSVARIGNPFGCKTKDLIGIPWRVAFALQSDGWYLRQDIIWHKPNPMPESVTDRCTKAHEYIFLLSKAERYYYDGGAVMEGAADNEKRNRRSVWTVATRPYRGAHFATFPPALIEPCILAGCPSDGTILDPFGGAGTTGVVAKNHGRKAILIELNPAYAEMARNRIDQTQAQQALL